jgi:hypothetical protein
MNKNGSYGPPPSVGWWPVAPHSVRWWNGKYWSWVCLSSDRLSQIKHYGHKQSYDIVKWFERPDDWPEHSKT